MTLEYSKLSEISQKEKDKYCVVSFIHGIFKKNTDFIETDNRMVVARSWEVKVG